MENEEIVFGTTKFECGIYGIIVYNKENKKVLKQLNYSTKGEFDIAKSGFLLKYKEIPLGVE
jgi:hypothetical protein